MVTHPTDNRPNLFVIGAMKSGTTSLHNHLDAHPDIFMSTPKEPAYFVRELGWRRGEPWYLSLFADAGSTSIRGESSTQYTKLPTYEGVPERIKAFEPTARFIYVMRDPIERSISHYWHRVRDHEYGAERRRLIDALRDDPQYVAYSDYARQLEPYFRLFDRQAVYTTTFEALVSRPRDELRDLFAWLGVECLVPESLAQRWNVAPAESTQVRGWGLLNRIRYSAAWGRIAARVPKPVRTWAANWTTRPVRRDRDEATRAAAYLRPVLRPKVEALCDLLGRDFPEWTTTLG